MHITEQSLFFTVDHRKPGVPLDAYEQINAYRARPAELPKEFYSWVLDGKIEPHTFERYELPLGEYDPLTTDERSHRIYEEAPEEAVLYAFFSADPNGSNVDLALTPAEAVEQFRIVSKAGEWNFDFYGDKDAWIAEIEAAAAAFIADPDTERCVSRDYDQLSFAKIVKKTAIAEAA
jgi:hypothetical protein